MYPQQPPQQPQYQPAPEQPQYSVDYLNQIAPTGPQRRGFSKKQWFLIGGLLLAVVIALGFMLNSLSGPNLKQQTEQLAVSLQVTQDVATKTQENLRANTIRSINSNLTINLTNINKAISEPLAKNGIKGKFSKEVVAAQGGSKLLATFEDARLLGTIDRTYAREMSFRLEKTLGQMKQLYSKTKSSSLKTFLDESYKNLSSIQEQLAEFAA